LGNKEYTSAGLPSVSFISLLYASEMGIFLEYKQHVYLGVTLSLAVYWTDSLRPFLKWSGLSSGHFVFHVFLSKCVTVIIKWDCYISVTVNVLEVLVCLHVHILLFMLFSFLFDRSLWEGRYLWLKTRHLYFTVWGYSLWQWLPKCYNTRF
jgi:hypothetical protein